MRAKTSQSEVLRAHFVTLTGAAFPGVGSTAAKMLGLTIPPNNAMAHFFPVQISAFRLTPCSTAFISISDFTQPIVDEIATNRQSSSYCQYQRAILPNSGTRF
jgi:hypothetical protein